MKNLFIKAVCSVTAAALVLFSFAACSADNSSTTAVPSNGSTAETTSAESVENNKTNDSEFTDRDFDASYNTAGACVIALNADTASITGSGAEYQNGVIKITDEGTYIVSGTLTDGRISIEADKNSKIQLVLNNASIICSYYAPISVVSADKVFVTLADGTENTVTDAQSYTLLAEDDNTDAAVFSKEDITFNGTGTLNVNANYSHGIVSKDDLAVTGGVYNITSVNTALAGKDCLKIAAGTFNLNAGSDGLKATNEEDAALGYVYISGGTFTVNAGFDGIQAATALTIKDGTFNITTGGGSANSSSSSSNSGWGMWSAPGSRTSDDTSDSAKAIKAAGDIIIDGGTFTIDSSDDSVHSNTNITINGGDFAINSGDDGMHADTTLLITGGTININKSYEGLEANTVSISGGSIAVTASDDGINAAGGADSSAMGGRPGQNTFSGNGSSLIEISGGYIVVNASGDGIDSNGNVNISGGATLVSGPTNGGNSALDYDGTASVTGGILLAAGSVGMVEGLSSSSSTQYSLNYSFTSAVAGGTSVAITDSNGNVLCSFTPSKQYQNIIVSTPAMSSGDKITVVTGGTASDADANGFASSGTLTGGSEAETVALSSKATTAGASYGSMGGMGGMGGMR